MVRQSIIFFLSLLTIAFVSCEENSLAKNTTHIDNNSLVIMRSMNDLSYPIDSLEKIVLEKGDIETYHTLMIELLDYNNEEMIKWAKIMADKHHYVRAYTDVFQFMTTCDFPTLSCLTPEDKETALKYLNLALTQGDSLALELKEEYKIN